MKVRETAVNRAMVSWKGGLTRPVSQVIFMVAIVSQDVGWGKRPFFGFNQIRVRRLCYKFHKIAPAYYILLCEDSVIIKQCMLAYIFTLVDRSDRH